MTGAYIHAERATVTWEKFMEMLYTEDGPLVERGRLSNGHILLKKSKKLVMEITNMFTEGALFCHKYATVE